MKIYSKTLFFVATTVILSVNDTILAADVIEEIVVTATKMGSSNLQETPLALEAILGDTLDKKGVAEFSDWAYSIPGLDFRDNGPGDKQYIIRGISSRAASPVGVYSNEAVLTANNTTHEGGGRNVEIKLHDIAQIEVLKGPQGTLYGASSMAGTIKIITREAEFGVLNGYAETSVATTQKGTESYNGNGMINIPLVEDQLALRLVGWYENNGGYIDQVRYGIENSNEEKTAGLRAQLRYQASENLTVKVMALHQNTSVDDVSRFSLNPAVTPPNQASQPLPGGNSVDLPGGEFLNNDYVFQPWEDELNLYSIAADWGIDAYNITLASSLLDRESLYTFDGAATIFGVFNQGIVAISAFPQQKKLWSNEIRIASNFTGSFNFVLGAFYQQENSDFDVEISVPSSTGRRLVFNPETEGLFGPTAGIAGNAIFGRTVEGELNQQAIFGELNFDLSEALTLLLGGRYFESTQINVEQSTKGIGTNGAGPQIRSEINSSRFTPKASLSFQVSDDAMVYLSYSEGFRVGGINQVTPFAPIPADYRPDSLNNYELGWKTSWLDQLLTVNGSIYMIDWQDIQVVQADNFTGIFNFVTNGGEAEIKGLELQLSARPSDALSLSLSGAYTEAEISENQPQLILGAAPLIRTPLQSGDGIPAVPKLSAALSADYTWWQINGSQWDLSISADVSYIGESETEGNNRNPFNRTIGDYTLVDFRTSLAREGKWNLTLFIDNVFDELAVVDIIADTQNPDDYTVVRPRTAGLRARVNF